MIRARTQSHTHIHPHTTHSTHSHLCTPAAAAAAAATAIPLLLVGDSQLGCDVNGVPPSFVTPSPSPSFSLAHSTPLCFSTPSPPHFLSAKCLFFYFLRLLSLASDVDCEAVVKGVFPTPRGSQNRFAVVWPRYGVKLFSGRWLSTKT